MIQVAIVEDKPEERERLRQCLAFLGETDGIQFHVTEFETGVAFIGSYRPEFDIVFMDIEMPGMDGLETARALRRMDPAVLLIFVTNMAQYAINGYEVDALDFILKPVNKYAFAMKVRRAVARTAKRTDEYITIRTDRESRQIRIAGIRYLEVQGHYVIFHTIEGDFTEYTTLKEAEERIGRDFFVHCSRSFLVNLRYVTGVNRETVSIGGEELTISRPQRKAFLTAVSEFMGGTR